MTLNFRADPNFVPPSNTFTPIPTGDYIVKVVDVVEKRTSTGSGLNLTFQVQEGSYANRRIWVLLNLDHPNREVTSRAYAELQGLCKAVGITGQLDLNELKGALLVARVYLIPPKDGFKAKNGARNFRAMDPGDFMTPKAKLDTLFGKTSEPSAEPATTPVEPEHRSPRDLAHEVIANYHARRLLIS